MRESMYFKLSQKKFALAMAEKGFTQRDLAREMGVTSQYVTNILSKNEVTPFVMGKLSKALSVSVPELIADEA